METSIALLLLAVECLAVGVALYAYLHKKTRISLSYIYRDNLPVVLVAWLLSAGLMMLLPADWFWVAFVLAPGVVVGVAFLGFLIRFYAAPTRTSDAGEEMILSPADGNVIYIKKIPAGQTPIAIKGKTMARLDEFTKTELLDNPCWLVGVNLTPFDVHRNSAPISGKVVLQKQYHGKFLSLKEGQAMTDTERNTFVFENDRGLRVGIVQIASKLVRKIESYKTTGDTVKRGEWVGMIKFGSQVDIILPLNFDIRVKDGEQIYAGKTILAAPLPNAA